MAQVESYPLSSIFCERSSLWRKNGFENDLARSFLEHFSFSQIIEKKVGNSDKIRIR
jgi:hypothetical protein